MQSPDEVIEEILDLRVQAETAMRAGDTKQHCRHLKTIALMRDTLLACMSAEEINRREEQMANARAVHA